MKVQIPCPCPAKPDGAPRHASDTVTLRDTLDFLAATAIRKAIGFVYLDDPGAQPADVLASLTERYILHGPEAWTLVDAKGKPLELTKPAIRDTLLRTPEVWATLSDAADELYNPQVLLPLLAAAQTSSPPTPPGPSTSPTISSSPKPRKPSKPSLTSTSPTDGIEMTMSPPDGVSSSLPSLPVTGS